MTLAAKVEQSISAVVSGLGITGLTVYSGLNNEEMTIPMALVYCESLNETAPLVGVWHCMVKVSVFYGAQETNQTDFESAVDTVFAALLNGTANLSSSQLGLTVMEVYCNAQQQDNSGDMWVKSIDLEVIANNGSN